MTTQTLTSDMTSMFTAAHRQALHALRDRYQQ
jgi:hypothetical protein